MANPRPAVAVVEAAPSRRIEFMPLSKVEGALRNPKRHAGEFIGRSIKKHGVVEFPALDERTGRLVAGHGRIEALRSEQAAGHSPPDGVQERDGEWFVPIIRGWSSHSDAQAEAYLVASNQTTIAGGWEDEGLKELLEDIQTQDPDLMPTLGFSEEQLDKLLDDTTSAPDPVNEDDLRSSFQVLVECTSERQQADLLARLSAEGLTVRSLIS